MAQNRYSARQALWLAALLPPAAHAGLSLDEALMRHRATLTSEAMADAFQPDDATPDGVLAAVGGPGETMPPLLRPMLPGVGGVQWTHRGGAADGLHWRAGAGWRDTDAHSLSLDGSELDYTLGTGEAYVSVQRRHWGPSWVGSLILDSAAPAIPSFGWRKNAATPFESSWLSWLGPWTADVFFGELSGHVQPEHPKLIGMRVQFMPLAGLEVGVSRTIQWGGSGRPETLSSLWQALVGHDNPVNAAGYAEEPGNQLGGFDLRYTLHTVSGTSYSVYGQGIGEDEANGLPTKYLGSAGVDAAFRYDGGSVRLFAETANTIAGGIANQPYPGVAYRHHIYLQGYTEQGKSLAFPAGGDVTLTSLGVLLDAGALSGMLMVHAGHAHQDAQFYPEGSLSGADATVAWRVNADWRVGAQVDAWRDPLNNQVRGQLWVQYQLP